MSLAFGLQLATGCLIYLFLCVLSRGREGRRTFLTHFFSQERVFVGYFNWRFELMDCLIDWLIGDTIHWLIGWLMIRLIDGLIDRSIYWLIVWWYDWLSDWWYDWLINWLINDMIAWLIDRSIDWLIDPFLTSVFLCVVVFQVMFCTKLMNDVYSSINYLSFYHLRDI